jgi:hypothetical protein
MPLVQIEFYEIYQNNETRDLRCVIKFGSSLNGHPGIVHGGITALLFDNSFGWLFFARSIPVGVTANLSVNYRAPVSDSPMKMTVLLHLFSRLVISSCTFQVMASTYAILSAKVDRIEGRKLFFSATLDSDSGVRLADATSLFISRKAIEEAKDNKDRN